MSERVKPIEVMRRNICPVCAKMDCPFLTKDKHCKEMMDAFREGDIPKAIKIYSQRYLPYAGLMSGSLKKAVESYDSIVQMFTSTSKQQISIPAELNTAIISAQSTLIPGKSINKATLAPVAIFTPAITTTSATSVTETLGAILGRALGLGAGLMLYSPPVGVGSDRYPAVIYQEYPKNQETALTVAGLKLNIPKEAQLRDIAKQKGIINTSATVIEQVVNGTKQIELVRTDAPVKTRVVEARKTVEKGIFAYTLPNEKQERIVQIGSVAILTGTALPQPERHKYLSGKVFDIPRFNNLPLQQPTFFTESEKKQSKLKEPIILVFPWELGIKPIYLSTGKKDKPRQGVKERGHSYHEPPKTQDIKGLGELKESKPKTPKQGGAGRRTRWIGDKGRKIYEWDYQHGEIEGYRASDGQHIGAFDPKTGNQLKPADPKRSIKKYL
ncbi:colicin E3/pyocin S6 family cytotoxin [Proteus sp. STS61-E]|uniref:colicin E3/pyocin S6 family cytotoxin n=1 Tax=Proteus sp. STS61-E TaxID=3237301 RepID=UPI0034C62B45